MIGVAVVHVVEAIRFSTDPKCAMSIDEQHVRTHGAAVETGNDKGRPFAVCIVLHAEPRSDAVEGGPYGSRGLGCDIDGAMAGGRIRQLFVEVRCERACRE